jgi:hypothetical protein
LFLSVLIVFKIHPKILTKKLKFLVD